LTAFAGTALALTCLGIYGTLSYVVGLRRREVGLRVALGASRGDILRLVLGRGLTMTAIGLAVGLLASVATGRLLRSFLFGVTPVDPVALTGSAAIMMLAAMMACYLPARRAAGADPISVLRVE
jgi:ABC-type antimicrobial peptide transport system permease subunit